MPHVIYAVQIHAEQIMAGAQAVVTVREVQTVTPLERKTVLRRWITASDLDSTTPEAWVRDLLVQVIEHL